MHYYKFNIGDYASHTLHLDLIEDLAYRRMLDWVYLHESPLPDSPEQIGRLIRMRTHSECIAVVLREFFTLTDHGWMQEKAFQEIEAYKEKSTKAKASAAARWSKKPIDTDANALPTDSERNANHKPLTTNHKTLTKEKASSTKGDLDWGDVQLSEQQKDDIKGLRLAAKAKLTQRALNTIIKELDKAAMAGIGYDEAIDIWALRSWKGFNAKWAIDHKGTGQQNQVLSRQDSKRETSVNNLINMFEPSEVFENGQPKQLPTNNA